MFTEQFNDIYRELWALCPENFPEFPSGFSPQDKTDREAVFTDYTRRFKSLKTSHTEGKPVINTDKFFSAFRNFMRKVYDYSDDALNMIMDKSFTVVSRSFFEQARAFDAELNRDAIFQAMRNVWIMNGLQLLLDIPVELSPSVFAYSLLYPYSDNLLDDPSIPTEEKILFSKRFLNRLTGQANMGSGRQEQKISELVGIIENQYPRKRYPDVHQSLLAIHDAQTQSIRLVKNGNQIGQDEVISMIFNKGGASVLADGFLVAGNPSPMQQKFFFGFGVWLQLVDDLQDLKEDTYSATRTLFSTEMEKKQRAGLSNRTIHFGRAVMNDIKFCPSDICDSFRDVIIKSIELMLVQAVGLNYSYFPSDYCNSIEAFSPVGFKYLRNAKKKGTPGRMKMISQLLEATL